MRSASTSTARPGRSGRWAPAFSVASAQSSAAASPPRVSPATASPTPPDAMATWILEPGHTEAEFRARHMMVTWVRGLFKDIHGQLELDWDHCLEATFE